VFDTGSADAWVFSSRTAHKLPYLHYFDGSRSSTCQPTSTLWSIRYGKGQVAGVLSRDVVRLGRYETTSGYTFAEAVDYSTDLVDEKLPLDGIVGMAFSELSRAKQPTLIDALHQQGQLKERIFSFYLQSSGGRDGSQLLIGPPDMSLAPQGLSWHAVLEKTHHWMLHLTTLGLGLDRQHRIRNVRIYFRLSSPLAHCSPVRLCLLPDGGSTGDMCDISAGHACVALIDTGTSFIGVPAAFYTTFARHIISRRHDCAPHGTTQIITCSSTSTHSLPTLAFTLSASHTYTLEPSDYLSEHTVGVMPLHTSMSGQAVELFILGDTFLRTFYTTFDMDRAAIGIANGKNVRREEAALWGGWSLWQLVAVVAAGGLGLCLLGLCLWRAVVWARGSSWLGGGAGASAPLWARPSSESVLDTAHVPQSTV